MWDFRVGDEIFAATSPTQAEGSYAQFALLPEHCVARKPKSLTHRESASLPYVALTAWEAIRVASVKRGDHVLVIGASGGVGHVTVQLLKHMGCTVYVTCPPQHISTLQSLGAHHVFDYIKKEEDATGNKYDRIFDFVGGNERSEAFYKLRRGGHLVTTVGEFIRRTDEHGIIQGTVSK